MLRISVVTIPLLFLCCSLALAANFTCSDSEITACAEHARVEQLRAPAFDVVTSRAFASLADFVRLTRELATPGGVWLAMKGKLPLDEIAELPSGFHAFHVERLIVPGLDAERCLIWIRKSAPRMANSESGRLQ